MGLSGNWTFDAPNWAGAAPEAEVEAEAEPAP
jgi:hypothetical protein